ncbi:MAG: hypothetical protein U5R06_12025 [candidate division KSB1 bacterium]|nr:hypothetical protein [candidate division KSB1 bacterium]
MTMPLLVRYPKEIKAGSKNTDLVSNMNFAGPFWVRRCVCAG